MRTDKEIEESMIEQLAELEHEQWVSWSKAIGGDQSINYYMREKLVRRWSSKWVPYKDLSEEDKAKDRIWARKAFAICMQTARILNDGKLSGGELDKWGHPAPTGKSVSELMSITDEKERCYACMPLCPRCKEILKRPEFQTCTCFTCPECGRKNTEIMMHTCGKDDWKLDLDPKEVEKDLEEFKKLDNWVEKSQMVTRSSTGCRHCNGRGWVPVFGPGQRAPCPQCGPRYG